MADVTVTERLEVNDPTVEVVRITASDGETYTSKKFGTIKGANLTVNTDSSTFGDYLKSTFTFGGGSGTVNLDVGTINSAGGTIQAGSATDLLCTLTLYGRK